tara:strand:+ start:350 stop:1504 length:1155 start_codon:yes stop_codon:yes gene_type:complete
MSIENQNHTLESLLETVRDQSARKADYIAQTDSLQVRTVERETGNETQVILEAEGGEPTKVLTANGVAFDQMTTKAGLDVRTGRRLQQSYPDVLDHALNRIHQQESRSAMLRTFDDSLSLNGGTLRAVVSDKFKTFDNPDLLEAVLPTLIESDAEWQIVNAQITDRRLYARFKSLAITGEGSAVGDLMAQGVVVGNSETGHGSVSVAQVVWTLACLNGMQTANKNRTAHLTSSRSDGDTWAMLTDESKRLDNSALSSKLRDITAAYASREMFESVLAQFRVAAADVVTNGMAAAQPAVAALGSILKLSKAESSSVLDGLMRTIQQPGYVGQPLSRATMVNAVTAAAHGADADSVSDWQSLGGKVLDLPANQWAAVASAPVAMAA